MSVMIAEMIADAPLDRPFDGMDLVAAEHLDNGYEVHTQYFHGSFVSWAGDCYGDRPFRKRRSATISGALRAHARLRAWALGGPS